MTSYSTTSARNMFGDIISRAGYGKERIALTRRGKTIAAVVPVEDLELLKRIQSREDAEDMRACDEAMKEYEKKGGILLEDIKKEIGF